MRLRTSGSELNLIAYREAEEPISRPLGNQNENVSKLGLRG